MTYLFPICISAICFNFCEISLIYFQHFYVFFLFPRVLSYFTVVCFIAFCFYFINAIFSFIPLKITNSFISKCLLLTMSLAPFSQNLLSWFMFWFFFPASLGAFLKYLSVFGTHKHIRNCVHTHIHMHFCLAWTKDCTIRFPYICFCSFFSLWSVRFPEVNYRISSLGI